MGEQSFVRRRRSSFVAAVTAAALMASTALSVVASTAAPTVAAAATSQDWPMFLHDSARSGATTDANLTTANVSNLKKAFAYKTGASIATSVSIVGTTAYVGSWDGYEYAINVGNGALIWKQFLGTTSDPGCHRYSLGAKRLAIFSDHTKSVLLGDNPR